MEAIHVIRKPLLTEKGAQQSEAGNQYSFEVDPRARKTEIKAAIEELFGVRVLSVNTINHKARTRRTRYGYVQGKTTKKAIVTLHDKDKIELF